MKEHSTWRLSEASASLQSSLLCGEVDLKKPERGLFNLRWRAQPLTDHEILGVVLDASEPAVESLADGYQRGADLIATYAQTAHRPMRVQVYWSSADAGALGISVDLQLSVQTNLLGIRPSLSTVTRLPAGEARRLVDAKSGEFETLEPWVLDSPAGPLCWLFRWPQTGLSYVELAFPGDSYGDRLAISETGRLVLTHRVFVEPLEKGVILRTRLRGSYLPSERDEELAAEAYREFVHSPPPLAT